MSRTRETTPAHNALYPSRQSAAAFALASGLFALCTVYGFAQDGASSLACIAAFATIASAAFIGSGFFLRMTEGCSRPVLTPAESGYPSLLEMRIPFLIIFASFFLNWLFNWPMAATSDSMAAINVALGNHELTAWHTLIWVAAVAPFVKAGAALGDANLGIAAYTLFQATAFAFIYAYVSAWVVRRGAPRKFGWAVTAFFALNPIVSQYAVYVAKDGPFATFFLLYSTLLFDVAFSKGKSLRSRGFIAAFAITTFLVASYRMNAIYATAAMTTVLLIVFRKTLFKRIAPLLLIPVLVWFAYGPACDMAGVQRSPFSESAGVPLSQIGYVLQNGGTVPDEAARELERVLPLDRWKDAYTPETVNTIKFHEEFDTAYLEGHKGSFVRAWLLVGIENPKAYLDAWLAMTQGFWNVDAHPDWIAPDSYTHYQDPRGYVPETEMQPSDGLLYPATGLEALHRDASEDIEILKESAVFYPFCNIACMVWFSAFALCAIATSKSKRKLWTLPLVALFIVYATVIVSTPVWCEFRYVYAFHLTMPITAFVLFLRKDPEANL